MLSDKIERIPIWAAKVRNKGDDESQVAREFRNWPCCCDREESQTIRKIGIKAFEWRFSFPNRQSGWENVRSGR